jgi:hypothetical protein
MRPKKAECDHVQGVPTSLRILSVSGGGDTTLTLLAFVTKTPEQLLA